MSGDALTLSYVRREMRAGLSGFYVFLACLILGVGAMAGVQSLSRGLIDSLRADGRYILGGDIAVRTIYTEPAQEQMAALKRLGRVSGTAFVRAMARRADEGKATMAEVKAVDGLYPLYGALAVTDGNGKTLNESVQALLARRDGRYGALAEKELLPRLNAQVGDIIRVGASSFTLRGVIAKEPDRISSEAFSIAPRVMIASAALAATGLTAPGSQVYYSQRLALPEVKTQSGLAKIAHGLRLQFPKANWTLRSAFNASPRLEEFIGRLTFFLTLISLSTLLVGGVGISNAVQGYLDSRLSHIATLKCLGAPADFIYRLYMGQILALAALGVFTGLGLGAAGATVAGKLLTARLALSAAPAIYPGGLGIAAACGMLTAYIFSLWPLGRAMQAAPADLFRDAVMPRAQQPPRRIRIRAILAAEALALVAIVTSWNAVFALWFAGGAVAVFALFRLYAAALQKILRHVRAAGRPVLRMAVANLHRPGSAAPGIILSLGIGLTVLSAVALVQFNFSRLIAEDLSQDAPSFFFLDIPPQQKDAFAQALQKYPGMRDLKLTPMFRGRITMVDGVAAEKALADKSRDWVIRSDRGFTYTTDLPAHSRITQGQWWAKDYKSPPAVSIATDVAQAFNIGVGDDITVNVLGLDITAKVMSVREVDWASFTMNFAVTFAPGVLEDAPATWLATVILDPAAEEKAQTDIAREFPGVTAVRVKDALETAGTLIAAVAQAIRIAAAVALLAGSLVVAGGVAAARRRHVYDAVILKVLGATRRRILLTFLLEYGMTGALTMLIAGVFGAGVSWAMLHYTMHMAWKFSLAPVASVAALCLGITLLAGFSGTWAALRQKPAAYLRAA